jgi:hypothetical protein
MIARTKMEVAASSTWPPLSATELERLRRVVLN